MNRLHSYQRRGHHPTLALGHTYSTLLLFFLEQCHLYRVRTFLNPHVCIPTTSRQLVGYLHSHEYQAKSLRNFHMCSRLKAMLYSTPAHIGVLPWTQIRLAVLKTKSSNHLTCRTYIEGAVVFICLSFQKLLMWPNQLMDWITNDSTSLVQPEVSTPPPVAREYLWHRCKWSKYKHIVHYPSNKDTQTTKPKAISKLSKLPGAMQRTVIKSLCIAPSFFYFDTFRNYWLIFLQKWVADFIKAISMRWLLCYPYY